MLTERFLGWVMRGWTGDRLHSMGRKDVLDYTEMFNRCRAEHSCRGYSKASASDIMPEYA